jgi:hypothetical protein
MDSVTRVPRSRGALSGVLLMLLGAWGGLAPFVGPYFHYAYTPDKAWTYNSGRLYLSIVPGAAALLGGLIATAATHRGVGGFGAFLAALGGAWFVVGAGVTTVFMKSSGISPGTPLGGTLGSLSAADKAFLEQLGLFTGIGVLILFFAATALGRFSVVGVRDAQLAAEAEEGPETEAMEHDVGYPATTGQYPAAGSGFRTSPTDPGPLRGPG